MQDIENWRVQELGLILQELVFLLRAGANPEWAGVFEHFDSELHQIASAKSFDSRALLRLVRNINACYSRGSSFPGMTLGTGQSPDQASLGLRFARAKADLWRALEDMEARLTPYVH